MNRSALVALFLGLALGIGLMASPGAAVASRLVGALSLILALGLGGLLLATVLRRFPKPLLLLLAAGALLYGLRSGYWLVRYHWFTPGLLVLAVLGLLVVVWPLPLRRPQLSSAQGALLAAFCGLAVVVQWQAFAPRDLLHTVKRWKHEPETRTPLSLATHLGLLSGLALLPLAGVVSVSSGSGSGETARP